MPRDSAAAVVVVVPRTSRRWPCSSKRLRKREVLRCCLVYLPFGLVVWLSAGQLRPSRRPDNNPLSSLAPSHSIDKCLLASTSSFAALSHNEPWNFPIADTHRRNLSLLVAQYAAPSSCSNTVVDGTTNATTNATTTSSIYDEMLQLTSTINQAYCRAWKCDYWIVRGIPFHLDDDSLVTERLVVQGQQRQPTTTTTTDQCGRSTSSASHHATSSSTSVPLSTTRTSTTSRSIPASRSTYNKVAILEMVLAHNNNHKDDAAAVQYDRLLLLDADAMLYDFDHDIATAIPDDRVVAAHRTHRNTTTTTTTTTTSTTSTSTNTGSINVGVTVWNLRHPLTALLVQKWKDRCLARIFQHKHDDDQAPLQQLLKHMPDPARDRVVYALDETLGYAQGRWVKHFIRRSNDWLPPASSQPNNDDNSAAAAAVRGDERRTQITHAVCEVCQRYWPVCQEQSEENRIDHDNGTGRNVSN